MYLWHVQGGKALICLSGVLLPPPALAESSPSLDGMAGRRGGGILYQASAQHLFGM